MSKIKKLISDYEKTNDPFIQISILGQIIAESKRIGKILGRTL
jgi:hypothetical protein